MKRFSTWLWSLVLTGSLMSLAAGFMSGRSIVAAAPVIRPRHAALPPVPAEPRKLRRALTGAHSFDAAEDDRDEFDRADDAVAARPLGWAPTQFDSRRDRARVALVVVDAGVAGTPAVAFVDSALPFALVVPADGDDGGILASVAQHRKPVLIDARGASATVVARARTRGAAGALGDFPDDAAAAPAAGALGGGIALDALLGDDAAFYRAARRAHATALTRDVIVDARDGKAYLDAMFGSALAIARRTGVAVVAMHARPRTLDAVERFAHRAARDGVDIVPITDITTGGAAVAQQR